MLSTRGLLNVLLLAAVLGLVLIALYQPGIKPALPPVKLTSLSPEQVQRIRIERSGKPVIVLTKEQGHWRITAPLTLPADDTRVASLLRLLQDTSQARFPAKPADLAKYKLERPALTVTFGDLPVSFGDTDPINGRRYVRIGDTVHLVTDMYYYQLDADPSAFVSPQLLPDKAQISTLALPDVTLQRDAQGHWSLHPERAHLSADAIQNLLDAWRNTRALWVKPYAQGTPLGSITVHLDAPAPDLHFDIMSKQPELVLARPDIGMQYHLSAESGAALLELVPPKDNKTGTTKDATTPP